MPAAPGPDFWRQVVVSDQLTTEVGRSRTRSGRSPRVTEEKNGNARFNAGDTGTWAADITDHDLGLPPRPMQPPLPVPTRPQGCRQRGLFFSLTVRWQPDA